MHVLSRTRDTAVAQDPGPPGPTAGELLRAARVAAGVSVEQVSAATRIRQAVVVDLEADRFDSSAGAVYARGHLRALAQAVGTDAGPVVEAFGRQTGYVVPTVPAPPPVPARSHPPDALHLPGAVPLERRRTWVPRAVLTALWLAAGALAVDTYRDLPAERTPAAVVPSPSGGTAPAVVASPKAAAPVRPVVPTTAALVVRVGPGGSWLRVSAAGRTLFEGAVADGWRQGFTDPAELRLRVGNAGAVALTCAGKDLGPAGTTGAVVTVRCGRTGVVPG